jgi:L-threonylcarbamoyladenylate synthase
MHRLLLPRIKRCRNNFQSKLLSNWHIRLAAEAINRGGVVAYPCEAVYGLGCSPWNKQAIERLLLLKRRPVSKGLIVVTSNIGQLHSLVNFDKVESIGPILETWPGHVTWVLPASREAPGWLTGENSDLAVRVSAHPIIRALCDICGPLVSTSANLTNTRSARSLMDVRNYFRDSLDYILPGDLGAEISPSEIREAKTGFILRIGQA